VSQLQRTERVFGDVFDIQRFSVNDGPGIRTIVFFKSCPLQCLWCSNPESQRAESERLYTDSRCIRCGDCVPVCPEGALLLTESGIVVDRTKCVICDKCSQVCPTQALRVAGSRMSADAVLREVERDRIFYRHSGGGMTLSGGEPLMQPDFASALLRGGRELGFHTAVETTGYAVPEILRYVLSQTDLILYDVKHMDPALHRQGTGASNERILENASLAASLGVRMVVRVPVIPTFSDSRVDILEIGRFVLGLGLSEIHLLPYHKYGVPKYAALGREFGMVGVTPPNGEVIKLLQLELQSIGLRVRVGG
jgi:pyruvate formate lyase activating enzyme